MRNVCLYIGLLVLLCTKGYSQATDVIFLIDNSSSIDAVEYPQMKTSIQGIIHQVLNCNENNRVAVVQYGGSGGVSRIYIESDFTTNETTGSTFSNRISNVGGADYAHEALGLIGIALDGTYNPSSSTIFGSTTSLNQLSTNSLVIFHFTDAWRQGSGSYLVNSASTGYGTTLAFQNYKDFKTIRNAKFVVVIVPPNAAASEAAAAIASSGGSYTGAIESYSLDPDAGTSRKIIISQPSGNNTGFNLSLPQIETVTDFICSVTEPDCVDNLTLVSVSDDVSSGTDNQQAKFTITASNKINGGAVGIYHAGDEVTLTSGFHSVNSSRFRAYIEGCTGIFEGRIGQFVTEEQIDTDLNFFNIAPNPASTSISVTSTEAIQSILITSLDGKTLYSNTLRDKTNSFDVVIDGYSNGMYNVTVIMANGEVETQKLVKN